MQSSVAKRGRCASAVTASAKRSFHCSNQPRFPLSDYNVFWLRQTRKWDFIEFGNHPEMFPGQAVTYLGPNRVNCQLQKHRGNWMEFGHDSLNPAYHKPPWMHPKPRPRVPCVLHGKNSMVSFTINRGTAERLTDSLRSRAIVYDLKINDPKLDVMPAEERLRQMWKVDPDTLEDDGESNLTKRMLHPNSILKNKNQRYCPFSGQRLYWCFLREVKRRYLFEDVEQLVFEEYTPGEDTTLVIPCRFYGLDQWFPVDPLSQWANPTMKDRPKYVQHCHEIEFKWNSEKRAEYLRNNQDLFEREPGFTKHIFHENDLCMDIYRMGIPSHISITVEQFCLPFKQEITLADVNLPSYLEPLKPANDIRILSLDLSHSERLVEKYDQSEYIKRIYKPPIEEVTGVIESK